MKDSVLLNLGVMTVPIGLVVAIEAINHGDSWWWFVLGVYGVVMSFLGLALIYILLRDAKRKDKENQIQQEKRDKVLDDTLSELRGFRQDLRGGEDKHGRR